MRFAPVDVVEILRGQIAERNVRPYPIVVLPPNLDFAPRAVERDGEAARLDDGPL